MRFLFQQHAHSACKHLPRCQKNYARQADWPSREKKVAELGVRSDRTFFSFALLRLAICETFSAYYIR